MNPKVFCDYTQQAKAVNIMRKKRSLILRRFIKIDTKISDEPANIFIVKSQG